MKVFILVYGHENHFWYAFTLKALANTDQTKPCSSAFMTYFPIFFYLFIFFWNQYVWGFQTWVWYLWEGQLCKSTAGLWCYSCRHAPHMTSHTHTQNVAAWLNQHTHYSHNTCEPWGTVLLQIPILPVNGTEGKSLVTLPLLVMV